MTHSIILPYDGSPAARATLYHAARAVQDPATSYQRVLLAVAGVDPAALEGLARESRAIAGPRVPLEVHLLHPGDPIADLRTLIVSTSGAAVGAPLRARGSALWYEQARRPRDLPCARILFFIDPSELRRFAVPGEAAARRGPWSKLRCLCSWARRGHEHAGSVQTIAPQAGSAGSSSDGLTPTSDGQRRDAAAHGATIEPPHGVRRLRPAGLRSDAEEMEENIDE